MVAKGESSMRWWMGWVKLFGDSTARQNLKFQPGGSRSCNHELNGGRQGVGRIQGAVWRRAQGPRDNARQKDALVHWLVHHCEPRCFMRPIRKGVEKHKRGPPIGPPLPLFLGAVPRKQPFFDLEEEDRQLRSGLQKVMSLADTIERTQ